jgi:hypothetical protein
LNLVLLLVSAFAADSIVVHTSSNVPEICRTSNGTSWTCGDLGDDDSNYNQTNQAGNVVFADFDRDGDLDAGGAATRNSDGQVVMRICDNDSAVSPWSCTDTVIPLLQSIGYFQNASAGDVDGDGDADIVTGDNSPNICFNDNGSFTNCVSYPVSQSGVRPRYIRDFNGDGWGDFLEFGSTVCYADVSGQYQCTDPGAGFDNDVGDFNNDGRPDYVNENVVCLNTGNSFSCSTSPARSLGFTLTSGSGVPQGGAVGDFDGDGNDDFASISQSADQIATCYGDGSGGFSCVANDSGTGHRALLAGDFDGDGSDELLTFWFSAPTLCTPNRAGTGTCVATNLPDININANQLAVAANFDTAPPLATPSLSISGNCPGLLTFDFSDFSPNTQIELGVSSGTGNFTITGSHPCSGTDLGSAAGTRRVATITADGNGDAVFQRSVNNANQCSLYFPAVDRTTCQTLAQPAQWP